MKIVTGANGPARTSTVKMKGIGSTVRVRGLSRTREELPPCGQLHAGLGGVALNRQDSFGDYSVLWRAILADSIRLVLFSKGWRQIQSSPSQIAYWL